MLMSLQVIYSRSSTSSTSSSSRSIASCMRLYSRSTSLLGGSQVDGLPPALSWRQIRSGHIRVIRISSRSRSRCRLRGCRFRSSRSGYYTSY